MFTIENKVEYSESASDLALSTSLGSEPKQIWKILPVPPRPGRPDPHQYYIQNAHFREKMVMQPLDFSSGGSLVLAAFNGSDIQKWRIIETAPDEPTDVQLSHFEWEDDLIQTPWYKPWKWHTEYTIKGKLTWKKNNSTSDLSTQKVSIEVDNTTEVINVGPDVSSYTFDLESSAAARSREHCFDVRAYSKWQAGNVAFSERECSKPETDEPTPPPTTGFSKLLVTNCHNDKKAVHLWTYDLTTDSGSWKDQGVLNSQWQGSGCPVGTPKEIIIADDHVYLLKAIDCGDSPPNNTNGSCHKLTSSQIKGQANGGTLTFQVN